MKKDRAVFRPSISIVVNTLNRASSLQDTLKGLSQLDYKDFEIVVINGPSTDGTSEILSAWRDRIKVGSCDIANLSISRNVGIAESSGEIVAFIDDDAVPHPQWLSRLASKYADPMVGGVGGFTVDNSGVRFQCRKTLCDRFGNAYFVSSFFDERPLNRPGSPIYPSLLGTNSSFRRDVLLSIGGFDHTFAYLLDETDVCLRIVDAGFKIVHEASALVFHQFAASHIRTSSRVARTVYPSATSKAYFIMRHGAKQSVEDAGRQLNEYREEILKSNHWLAENRFITAEHRVSLDQDLLTGINEGTRKAYEASAQATGHLSRESTAPFKRFLPDQGLRVALVSQSYPPDGQAGIARWTWMVANGLSRRGHAVHVVTRAAGEQFSRFESGVWVHAVSDNPELGEILAAEMKLPPHIAARGASVKEAVTFIKSFGIDVLSFPIWDVEGIACIDEPDIGIVMSLHTSYSLAKPHKREWSERPLYEHFGVLPVIAAETRLLASVPTILANSQAIVTDLEKAHEVSLLGRVIVCPHGTIDPFAEKLSRQSLRGKSRTPVKILYAGRFEARKGFDIAAKTFSEILRANLDVQIDIVGEQVRGATEAWLNAIGAGTIIDNPMVSFRGLLDREELDDAFSAADIVIMPSRYESFGLVAIEAMAAGAAVVALQAGGLAEVIEHDVSGLLVVQDGNELETFVKYVTTLVNSPDMRERLGARARQAFLEKFTIEKMIDGVELALKQAIRHKGDAHGS